MTVWCDMAYGSFSSSFAFLIVICKSMYLRPNQRFGGVS